MYKFQGPMICLVLCICLDLSAKMKVKMWTCLRGIEYTIFIPLRGSHWKNTNSCSFDPSIWHLWTFFLSYCNVLSSTVQEVSCVSCANFTGSLKSTILPKFCASSLLCYLNISGKDHIMNFAKMSDSKNSIWAARPISVFKFLP